MMTGDKLRQIRLVPGEARHSIWLPHSDRAETTSETTVYIEFMKGDNSA